VKDPSHERREAAGLALIGLTGIIEEANFAPDLSCGLAEGAGLGIKETAGAAEAAEPTLHDCYLALVEVLGDLADEVVAGPWRRILLG